MITRVLAAWLVFAGPVAAWEYTPGLPCVLNHKKPGAEIELTYDPRVPRYSVTIRQDSPWPDAPVFAMRFDGASGLTISTDRHSLGHAGRSVTVIDRGFGNVLDGLQFNDTVTAGLGDQTVTFSLDGAAGPVAAFRQCRALPGV